DALFPAASTTVPLTVWFPPFEEINWSGGQVATPAPASAQVKCAVTGVLFQPLALADGLIDTFIVGAVTSMPNAALVTEAVLPALSVAVPTTVCAAPSALTIRSGGHDKTPESGSVHVKCAVTGPLTKPAAFG